MQPCTEGVLSLSKDIELPQPTALTCDRGTTQPDLTCPAR